MEGRAPAPRARLVRRVRPRTQVVPLAVAPHRPLPTEPGRPDDFEEATFSPDAHRIARILLLDGRQSTAVLREALDVEGSRGAERFGKAVGELARALVITNFGTKDEGHSWPSVVLELTTRVFKVPKKRDADACRLNVARTFLDTMLVAQPYHLGNAFHAGATAARESFEELVALGEAERDGPAYRLVRSTRPSSSRRRSAYAVSAFAAAATRSLRSVTTSSTSP